MPSSVLPTPTPEELDDLIYHSRTGDLHSLQALVTQLCKTHSCPPSVIIASAIDIDEDGLGSQSCLLHYAAANGESQIITYLLSLIQPSSSGADGTTTSDTTADGDSTMNLDADRKVVTDKSAPSLINHRNVSGNTPLHWAALNGKLEIVKLLVAAGADASLRNEAGRDCVVEAEMSSAEGAKECAEWMEGNCGGMERGVGGGGRGLEEEEVVVEGDGKGESSKGKEGWDDVSFADGNSKIEKDESGT